MTDVLERLKAALGERNAVQRGLRRGWMALVCLADDLRHERRVAMKALRRELRSVVVVERVLHEIKRTAALARLHILPVLDSGEADGLLYCAMPCVEGGVAACAARACAPRLSSLTMSV